MRHVPFESFDALTRACVALLRDAFGAGAATPSAVMLSGGRTPLAAYEALARSPSAAGPRVHVFFSDERMVPHDAPDSNCGTAAKALAALALPAGRVFTVQTASALDEAAQQYHDTLRRFLEDGGRIPLGLLGLGADGHTASLFTQADLDRAQDRLVIAVPRATPPDRVTVTPNLLRRVERLVVLTAGPDKAAVVQTLLRAPERLVAGRALAGAPSVEVWTAP